MSRILITGGNGFIGSHLAEKLEGLGEDVTLFDLDFNSNTRFLNSRKVRGDILDYDSVSEVVDGKDAVFHFAAVSRVAWGQEDPFRCWQTNQQGTLNVLEACRKAQTRPVMFYASSREVYGEPLYLPVNESHPKKPISIYGMTKLCAERACTSYSPTFGLGQSVNQITFRFSNVYGSTRDLPSRVIPKFMMNALQGEDISLYGGDQVLDFTFIDDTISGIMKAYTLSLDGHREIFGEDFHFVTGRGVSVLDLAKMIINIVGSPSKIITEDANSFEVRRFIGDPRKSHKWLGYEPRVRLEDGLRILSERIAPSIQAR
jgi:UDP-glucose 4-epimerase